MARHPAVYGHGRRQRRRRPVEQTRRGRNGRILRTGVRADLVPGRVYGSATASEASQPGLHRNHQRQPVYGASDRTQLPERSSRRPVDGGGRQNRVRHQPDRGHAPDQHHHTQHTHPRLRELSVPVGRLLGMPGPALHHDHLPPGGHVQNGSRERRHGCGRRSAPGQGPARPAGCGRVRNAHHCQRQHERSDHHDRRESLRHDQAGLGRSHATAQNEDYQEDVCAMVVITRYSAWRRGDVREFAADAVECHEYFGGEKFYMAQNLTQN